MYSALYLILLAVGAWLFFTGLRTKNRGRRVAGLVIAAVTVAFFEFLNFWGEVLWFRTVGYGDRLWVEISATFLTAVGGGLIGWFGLQLLTLPLGRDKKFERLLMKVVGGVAGLLWGYGNWELVMRFLNRVSTGVSEPIFGLDASFYLFTLPLLDGLQAFLGTLVGIAIIGTVLTTFVRMQGDNFVIVVPDTGTRSRVYSALFLTVGVMMLVVAVGQWLERYSLMYSRLGVVSGPGWTDVNVRIWALALVAVVVLVGGVILLVPKLRNRFSNVGVARKFMPGGGALAPLWSVLGVVVLVWVLALNLAPALVQWLRVEPNEITLEKRYIANNIELTRYGFGLDDVQEREFPVTESLDRDVLQRNETLFENIRLWDYRALDAVYKQFQEIRLYYEFVDVDIDRYTFNGEYRSVMVSAREMEPSNLPAQSQTFINQRFKYTHGYGITMAPVSEYTPQGLPRLLIRDIPPVSEYASLEVTRPEIYYGELTDQHVIANSAEQEFDYPAGEENVYNRYDGKGGVQISNLWRKFLFGYKFDGTRLLLSSYPTSESRILFHREIKDRVNTLAPFLQFDKDPYVVLVDGRLKWIIDAYTTSDRFPYSEPFSSREIIEYKEGERTRRIVNEVGTHLHGINYIRNSVKCVVDAYDGTVDFYVFEEEDPLIRVWDKVYPGLLKPRSAMPEAVEKHVRYPTDLLLVQGLVFAKYHMTDPMVFYNQEDLWVRATEKYHSRVQPVEPYYIMWKLPEAEGQEFSLILPFTPKNRQVMIGWIAGLCDEENYGRFLAYKFPKEKRVLGPQQVETKIDQDPFLSGQLSLWDQRGSSVIRGNVLAIPVEGTIIYVEPIYLQAETAAYPELRLVAVMHNDELSYAESFDEALRGLFDAQARELPGVARKAGSMDQWIERANTAFQEYQQATGRGDFESAATSMQQLREALEKLTSQPDVDTAAE